MKKIKKIFLCLLVGIMTLSQINPIYAVGSASISAAKSKVEVGSTVSVTITIPSDAEAWTYSVSYSSNLTYVSGTLEPMGFEGDSRTNTLVFRANAVGEAKVSAYAAGGMSIGGSDYDINLSKTINIVAVSTPPSGSGNGNGSGNGSGNGNGSSGGQYEDTRSSNNSLISLEIEGAELLPEFDSATLEYEVELPVGTTEITISAEKSDSKAKLEGTGTFSVKAGNNTFDVVCTAEDGNDKTYRIRVYVEEEPSVFTTYDEKRLGVVKNTRRLEAPEGFEKTISTVDGQEVDAWTNKDKTITLLYLIDDSQKTDFYVYDLVKGVQSVYHEITFNEIKYVYAGTPETKEIAYLTYGNIDVLDKTIKGFTYQDKEVKDVSVLYLMGPDGTYGYYQYNHNDGSLQIFNGAVLSESGIKEIQETASQAVLYRNISVGVNALLALIIIILLIKRRKNKKEPEVVYVEKKEEQTLEQQVRALYDEPVEDIEENEELIEEVEVQEDEEELLEKVAVEEVVTEEKEETIEEINEQPVVVEVPTEPEVDAFSEDFTLKSQQKPKRLKTNIFAGLIHLVSGFGYIGVSAANLMEVFDEKTLEMIPMIVLGVACFAIFIGLISLIISLRKKMKVKGNILAIVGHSVVALLGSDVAFFALVLCVLGAILTFKDNRIDE